MRKLLSTLILILFAFVATAQNVSISIGTDIPYQHYVGLTLETKRVDVSYRVGILVPPYSDIILNTLEAFEVDDIYIDLLDASYNFGIMNSLGGYYKFGKERKWYAGAELRLDRLTASETRSELVAAATGQSVTGGGRTFELGLTMYAAGMRLGRNFQLSEDGKHRLRAEFSIAKHLATNASLLINGNEAPRLTEELDELLWEDVFKEYGMVGGLGIAYVYKF